MVFKEAHGLGDKYNEDNQWAKLLEGGRGSTYVTFEQFALAAALAYTRVPNSKEHILLLGDTKIRSDAELILNFGISGDDGDNPDPATCQTIMMAMGKDDAAANLTIKDLENYRNTINKGQSADVRGERNKNDVPLYGKGSLLSNPLWSPILNDAFILSGLHTNLLFVVALNVDEQADWNAEKQETVKNIAKLFGGQVARPADAASEEGQARIARETWKNFILAHEQMIWDTKANIPRVFMRELLGLKAFGYKPKFHAHQLSFVCADAAKADEATLGSYVSMLRDAKFREKEKGLLMKAIGEFLFDDPQALARFGAAAGAKK